MPITVSSKPRRALPLMDTATSTSWITPTRRCSGSTEYGNFLTKFSITGPAKAIAVDLEGNVSVAEYTATTSAILKYDGNGRLLLSFGSYGTGNGQFNAPQGIAVSATSEVFVSDTGNQRIEKFDSYGNYLLQFGSNTQKHGNGNGQFNGPRRLAVDASGNVFVPDTINNRVQKFDNYGNYLAQFGGQGAGNGLFDCHARRRSGWKWERLRCRPG